MMIEVRPDPDGYAIKCDQDTIEILCRALFDSNESAATDLHFMLITSVQRWPTDHPKP